MNRTFIKLMLAYLVIGSVVLGPLCVMTSSALSSGDTASESGSILASLIIAAVHLFVRAFLAVIGS